MYQEIPPWVMDDMKNVENEVRSLRERIRRLENPRELLAEIRRLDSEKHQLLRLLSKASEAVESVERTEAVSDFLTAMDGYLNPEKLTKL